MSDKLNNIEYSASLNEKTEMNEKSERLWNNMCKIIKNFISEEDYGPFFPTTRVLYSTKDEDLFIINVEVTNKMVKEKLEAYNEQIEGTLRILDPTLDKIEINYEISKKGSNGKKEKKKKDRPQLFRAGSFIKEEELNKINSQKNFNSNFQTKPDTNNQIDIKPDFTFKNYITGKSNQFAQAVSMSVAKSLGKLYNPLFIYGGVGLGKTHLMHAIANDALLIKPDLRVLYVHADRLMHEYVVSIQQKKQKEFRDKYAQIDLFLVDDIQFLSKGDRKGTREEFFHIYETLKGLNSQIVLTSDRPPKKLDKYEDRLISRFSEGMLAEILQPDLELRVAILKSYLKFDNIQLLDELIVYLAENVDTNIRELKGAYQKLRAYTLLQPVSTFSKHKIDEWILRDIVVKEESRIFDLQTIKSKVAEYFSINVIDLESKKRSKNIAFPRAVAMYLARELTDETQKGIGESFGGKDHTAVLYAHRKIANEMSTNFALKEKINDIKDILLQN